MVDDPLSAAVHADAAELDRLVRDRLTLSLIHI